ncbi:unnamed protein product [Thelazia callipaeda]|uniref:UBIQUITIN_CONJUGAT_2 domain-containing protein n=1 Tax=Thelazia callipaeda TaxID=103827 RepID=A0A0N5D4U9_THECL|nr:unnamed protein product [Thelazia callipaeda]
MFMRASSVERQRLADRDVERVCILKDECSTLEAANSFDWEKDGWDPRMVGLLSDSLVTSSVQSVRRLTKEMRQLRINPVKYCLAAPSADNIYKWTAVIDGPKDTVYEGGTFFLEITVPSSYPFNPPKYYEDSLQVQFLTRIYHCNINRHGVVDIDVLRDRWSSSMTISTILEEVVALLYECKPENALLPNIAEQYCNNRREFDVTARLWTLRFAC